MPTRPILLQLLGWYAVPHDTAVAPNTLYWYLADGRVTFVRGQAPIEITG